MRVNNKCPICGNKVKYVGRKELPAKRTKSFFVKEFLCGKCNFQGTVREFEIEALKVIDDRYAFYYCKEYNLALFFREKRPQVDPILQEVVDIPALDGKEVTVQLVGLGQHGKDKLLEIVGPDAPIFPVDLWCDPGYIDPRPSRTVDETLMDRWKEFVSNTKCRPVVSGRRDKS